ncbi:MAG TPA: glycoside hydrolase family 38 C-terminal domain-containing protein [Gaiellaceae bacterium]|nr:glycoside hydrolase family 38 C-terminal domain-containing protein [Gaiellaceae bacterium]
MKTVYVVPHTHWDREWYLPFQTFRLRLVELVDRVLDLMESEPGFVFTLDGQLATVDDYLELRPESEPRLRRLIAEGRLAIGPWQTLVDEFLVSGESIIRNLEVGWARAEELGRPMPIGYLPDMFGHVAQMPQILRRSGIEQAVVWRGVPAAIDQHAFLWESPDGSAVRAEYLVNGYGNAAHLFDEPDLAAAVAAFDASMRPFFGEDESLAMTGTDHMLPPLDLAERVARLNEEQDGFRLELVTLADYLARPENGAVLTRWRGEMRSAARANLLTGVTSARIDLKAACARAERALERYAEPLAALYAPEWPGSFLRLAWSRVLDNAAHDSICGCSVDAVSTQVLVRYAEAEQIASGLAQRAAATIATGVSRGAVAIVNPSPVERTDVVELDFEIPADWDEVELTLGDGTVVPTQELARADGLLLDTTVPGRELPEALLRRVHGRELFGLWLNGFSVGGDGSSRSLTFDVGADPDPEWLDLASLREQIAQAVAEAPDEEWGVRIVARPRRSLAAAVPAPALGWTSARPARARERFRGDVRVNGHTIGNGLLEVGVDADGTLRVGSLEGVGRLVDGGDFGDSYNYGPPRSDTFVSEPETVSVEVLAAGPIRAELAVVRSYRWPLAVKPDGSSREDETALVPVTTRVELRAGEPFVRLEVSFDNPCSDHRLRFHVPLASPAETACAEGQLGVVERGVEVEAGHGEVPLATAPARGFVAAGGVAVLLDHVLEYELLEGRELALTLLRSIGLISRSANPYREDPAGPEIAMPDGQLHGPCRAGFALFPYEGSWVDADVLAQMERYQHPFLVAPGTGGGSETGGTGLELEGKGVVLSSLRRRDDWLELRLVCQLPEPRTVVLRDGVLEAREADLLGRPGSAIALDGDTLRLELGPWEIRTVQLRRS